MFSKIRVWWKIKHWRKCDCGKLKVAPGTRTELAGMSHGDIGHCFYCDANGEPLWPRD